MTASQDVFLGHIIGYTLPVVGAIHESSVLSDFVLPTEVFRLRRRLKPLFLSRRKKKREKERPLRGLRREVSPDLLWRTEINSKTGAQCGSAPRDPPRNGQAGGGNRQRQRAQRKKFLYSGRKTFVQRSARIMAFPSRGSQRWFAAGCLII